MIDHKALLEKYMRLILECEGVDYLIEIESPIYSQVQFTDDEVAELKRISSAINESPA